MELLHLRQLSLWLRSRASVVADIDIEMMMTDAAEREENVFKDIEDNKEYILLSLDIKRRFDLHLVMHHSHIKICARKENLP